MLRILDRFLRARDRVGKTPADVVHRENKWRLLRYRARADGLAHREPILLVPSLINRHYVLDLMPGKSFVQFLVGRGHDVFIIDWGTPGDEDRYLTFDDVCDRYLGRALRKTCQLAGADKAHVLGYCLGGTLAAIHAAVKPERIASFVALAAPIAFHDEGALSRWTRIASFAPSAIVEAHGNVPWQLMQASFYMLKPTLMASKTVGFVDRMWDDAFLDSFFAIETWGNDNVSLPGAFYERYVGELYRQDALVKGTFTLSGKRVDLGAIRCPTLAVTFADDHIVPPASAAVLVDRIGAEDKELLELRGGHVGAVLSRRGAEKLWPRIADFWEQRMAGPQSGRAPVGVSTGTG